MSSQLSLTLYFENSHWRALLERRADGLLSIASHIFPTEPSEAEALAWWLTQGCRLSFSLPQPAEEHGCSPRRGARTRQAANLLRRSPITAAIRSAAQAERKRRRAQYKTDARQLRLLRRNEEREKRTRKARQKRRGR